METGIAVDLFDILLLLGAVQGIFLAILLFTKYRRIRANIYLGFLILFYSLFIFSFMISNVKSLQQNYPHWLMILSGLPFLFGPLHLIYVGELTDTHLKFARFHWYHFLPFVLYKLYYLQVFFITVDELAAIFRQINQNARPLHIAISGLILAVIGVGYMIIALVVLRRYSVKIQNVYSSLDKVNLYWLRFFTYAAMFVWTIVLLESLFTVARIDVRPYFLIIPLLTSVFIYAIGYIGLYKTEIFEQPEVQKNLKQAHEIEESKRGINKDIKYEKSGLTEEKAVETLKRLEQYMKKDKPYLNPNLTLNDLSEKLVISSHNLSEILNTQLNQNFFDFINQYRVNEVKKNLADRNLDHLTLLSIAFDAGFNSKSGFNAIFKRYTDITPSQYREKIRT